MAGGATSADQRIPRGTADPLANPIDKAGHKHRLHRVGQRKQRLGQGGQPVAQQQQSFAPSQVIAEGAGEDLHDQCRRLGHPFEQPYAQHAGPQGRDQKQRQQAMHQFGGEIHQQADQAQRPDSAGNGVVSGQQ